MFNHFQQQSLRTKKNITFTYANIYFFISLIFAFILLAMAITYPVTASWVDISFKKKSTTNVQQQIQEPIVSYLAEKSNIINRLRLEPQQLEMLQHILPNVQLSYEQINHLSTFIQYLDNRQDKHKLNYKTQQKLLFAKALLLNFIDNKKHQLAYKQSRNKSPQQPVTTKSLTDRAIHISNGVTKGNSVQQALNNNIEIAPASIRYFDTHKYKLAMPLKGRIKYKFQQDVGNNKAIQGFFINNDYHSNILSEVTAPFDGQVLFAGDVRYLGLSVILGHGETIQTVLSGFDKLDVVTGQWVLQEEILGSLENNQNRNIYFEVRENGIVVDPRSWLTLKNSNQDLR